jgi:thioredoxin 1
MKHLTESEFNPAITNGIVVIDFFAERCGPCKMIAPYLEQMQEKLGETVQFYKVDVDQENNLAAQQGITAMPTLKIFNNGKEVKTIVGADLQGLFDGIQNELKINNYS